MDPFLSELRPIKDPRPTASQRACLATRHLISPYPYRDITSTKTHSALRQHAGHSFIDNSSALNISAYLFLGSCRHLDPRLAMDLVSCRCAKCDAKLGAVTNAWSQIGKKYLTPVAASAVDSTFVVSTSGTIRSGYPDTLVGGW